MCRQPPSFTLFPYTTLFRSFGRTEIEGLSSGFAVHYSPGSITRVAMSTEPLSSIESFGLPRVRFSIESIARRSEEHTSELQSRQYLVCRLLLEKKKEIQK